MSGNNIFFAFLIVCGVVLTNHICMSYLSYTVDATQVCSPFKNTTLKLGAKYNEHGIVIKETSKFSNWFGHKLSECRFEVKEHRKNKIIAVIQNLSFRRDELGNCTDYVQFKSGMEESQKFCGLIKAMHPGAQPVDPDSSGSNIAPNAFIVQDEGTLDVIIYVANEELRPEDVLDLEIVFTSARDCPTASHEYSVCGYNLCIRREFLKDGFVNCPFVNCPDEDGCYKTIPGRRKPGVGSRVTVGAITAVLMSFVLFFGCIWLSRRYHRVCWSAEFSRARISRMVHIPPEVHQHMNSAHCDEVISQHGVQTTPSTVPPPAVSNDPGDLAVAAAVTPDDKDLPPSYESLFPGR